MTRADLAYLDERVETAKRALKIARGMRGLPAGSIRRAERKYCLAVARQEQARAQAQGLARPA